MRTTQRSETVLAIYPTTRGMGFIVMRSPLSPADWGTRYARGKHKNASCLEKVASLIEAHQPDAIVLEDPTAAGSKRTARIRRLCRAAAALANSRSVEVHVFPRGRIQECFELSGAKTRYDIAMVIAKQVSALERFLPPKRKYWELENPKMSIFNAAALAMTYFATAGQ